jgi:beta-exotoxin I transport system permease protein
MRVTLRKSRSAELHSVFERTFHEQRRALYGWGAGMFLLALTITSLYPTIRGNPQLATLHETYPKALRSLFGITDLTTGVGFLRAELFSLVAPMLIVVLGILWGGDMIAGEEDRGTIDVLMANPISRRRVVLEKWAALVLGIAAAAAALGLGLVIGVPAAAMHVGWGPSVAAIVSTAMLGVLFGTVALTLSAATGRRGLARGTTAVLAVAAYLLSSLADLVSWLRPLRPLSPWYHALGIDPLASGFSPWHFFVLVVSTVLIVAVSVVTFERRDLAV